MNKPNWLLIAEKEIGVHEIKGGENSRIIEYHATTTLGAKEDEIPWCSSFVNWCLKQVDIVGTNSAAAASWDNWGESTEPKEGCICRIRQKRKSKDTSTGSSSGNHVAFFQKIEGGRLFLLGGNQSDSVKVSSFGLESYEIVSCRWPKTIA